MTSKRSAISIRTTLLLLLSVGILTGPVASAHHSFPETYNTSQIVEIEGVVTDLKWRNPHVELTVRNRSGETWNVESNSIAGLERAQLSAEVVAVGVDVKIAGFPARDGSASLYTTHMLLRDGRELLLRPGVEPRWTTPAPAP